MRETDIIPKGIVKRQKSTFEPLASSSLRSQDSFRSGELGIRRAYTETKTIRAKIDGDLREVLVTVLRESPPPSLHKKPPDIELSLAGLKGGTGKMSPNNRLLLLDTFSETSTEVPQTPKYAYTDNEDDSEADTTARTVNSKFHHERDPVLPAAQISQSEINVQFTWIEVFALLLGLWLSLQLAQSLVTY